MDVRGYKEVGLYLECLGFFSTEEDQNGELHPHAAYFFLPKAKPNQMEMSFV
jgi:hypothetical protein